MVKPNEQSVYDSPDRRVVLAREYRTYDTMLQEEMDAAMDDPPEEGEEVYEAYEGRLIDYTAD